MPEFPEVFSNVTPKLTEITAALINHIEQKIGIDLSADVNSLDYGLRNPASEDPGHLHDHEGLLGRDDDDHPQYILHSLATAINDFLIASGEGAYVKKTLAEVKVILELPASPYVIGDLFYASSITAQDKLAAAAAGNVLISGVLPSWGKVVLTTHVSGILPPVNGGDGRTTINSAGPVAVTTALNRQTFVATAAVEYDLPTGDLSAFVDPGVVPLKYTFVKSAAGTVTIDPGAGNFIASGAAAAKMYNDTAGETYATVTLQLISSAGSVNKWVVVGIHGTWPLAV